MLSKAEKSNERTKIRWNIDLKRRLSAYKEYFDVGQEVYLRFDKIRDDEYRLDLIIPDQFGVQYNDNLHSEVLVDNQEGGIEGKKVAVYTSKYERNLDNRRMAILYHGLRCQVCDFDFEAIYGVRGKNYIEVHHTKPLFNLDKEIVVNPKTDLVCVCANCHRMIHRKRDEILTVDELKDMIKKTNKYELKKVENKLKS